MSGSGLRWRACCCCWRFILSCAARNGSSAGWPVSRRGILGDTGRALAIGINAAILAFALGRWLGGRTFPKRENIPTILNLSARQRAAGRFQTASLGFLTGLLSLLGILSLSVDIETDILGVLSLPVFAVLSYVLVRLGSLIWQGGSRQDDDGANFSNRVVQLLGRAVQLCALVAPLLAAIGFYNLARGILFPVSLCLGLVALLIAVHYFLRAGYAMIRGLDEETSTQALLPVVASLLLTLASVPLFALILGARSSDLGEVWAHFKNGVRLGDTTISLPSDSH